jgi:hypothetical protein
MGAQADRVRERLREAFSRYKFKDARMCCDAADGDLLAKRLSKKPLREFTADDTLSFARLLQCDSETGAKFILPKLLDLHTPEAEMLIREKQSKLRLHFTAQEQLAVDAYLEEEWRAALGTRDLPTILNRLSFSKVLSGRVEPFLAEWLGSGPSVHPSIVELALSIWRLHLQAPLDSKEIRDWLLTDVARVLQESAGVGPLRNARTEQALALLRGNFGQ